MKEASPDTQRVLIAAEKASKVLDNLDLNDHVAALAVLEQLAQQRAEKRIDQGEAVGRVISASRTVAEGLFAVTLQDHAQVHAILKVVLMRRLQEAQNRRISLVSAGEAALEKAIG